jgi:hypothetical protein
MTAHDPRSYTTSIFEPENGYDSTRRPAPPCSRCHGDGQVCNACERPGAECRCPDSRLPTPRACPQCSGDTPPRLPKPDALLRLHWWCMRQAARFDRSGYDRPPGCPLLARAFDWVGGRAANLYRWREGR